MGNEPGAEPGPTSRVSLTDLDARVTELEGRIAELPKRIDDGIASVANRVHRFVETQVEEHLRKLDPELLARREKAIAEAGGSAKATIRREAGQVIADMKPAIESLMADFRETLSVEETFARNERARVSELVEDLSKSAQDAATGVLVDAYAMNAQDSRKRAWRWTLAALAAAVLAVAVAVVQLLEDPKEISTTQAVTRSAISLSALVVAGFLARIASEERRDARSATHMQLQLATSRAYIDTLPTEQRAQAQLALTLQFFPGQTQDPHGGGAAATPSSVADLLGALPGAGSGKS